MKKSKKSEQEWLKEMKSDMFREVFIEWYIPAIKNKFYLLEDRVKKLEDTIFTEGGGE